MDVGGGDESGAVVARAWPRHRDRAHDRNTEDVRRAIHRPDADDEARLNVGVPAAAAGGATMMNCLRGEPHAHRLAVMVARRGTGLVGARACADRRDHVPGERARRTRPQLPAGHVAARQHGSHGRWLHRWLAVVRRHRRARSRLGLFALSRVSVERQPGHHPARRTDARPAAAHVLARRLLGRALRRAPVVPQPALLGQPLAPASAAAGVAPATAASAAHAAGAAAAPVRAPAAVASAERRPAAVEPSAVGRAAIEPSAVGTAAY